MIVLYTTSIITGILMTTMPKARMELSFRSPLRLANFSSS